MRTYLVYCAEGFLEALEEARTLASGSDVAGRFVDAIRHGSDLLDAVEIGLDTCEPAPAALDVVSNVRELMRSARGELGRMTIH